jgi:PTS system glucose-specific IIC component
MGPEGIQKFNNVFTSNVGITSLSTSVFGGIIVGFIVAYLYNKFKNIQLPSIIGFFSGVRFIPIITFMVMILVGLIISMVWPLVGIGLYAFGNALGSAPAGVNSFVFGLIQRSLVPFGLHHAFYAPL